MSDLITINVDPSSPNRSFFVSGGTMLDIRDFLRRYMSQSAVLLKDKNFIEELDKCSGGVLSLERCSLPTQKEVARLILDGSAEEHDFWNHCHGWHPSSKTREIFQRFGETIIASLQESEDKRSRLPPHQRLCAALRFRVADGMNEFLESQGIKPHELSRIKERIDQGEWPVDLTDYLPGLQRYFMQRMIERKD